MLINEVVGTGIVSRFLSRFKGNTSRKVVQLAINQWSDYAKKLETAGVKLMPQNYEQELNTWLGKWFEMDKPFPGKLPDVSGMNGASVVNDYIAKSIAQFETGRFVQPDKKQKKKKQKSSSSTEPKVDDSNTVPSGKRLVLTNPKTNSTYYKIGNSWYNWDDKKIVKQSSIEYLEGLINAPGTNTKIERIIDAAW